MSFETVKKRKHNRKYYLKHRERILEWQKEYNKLNYIPKKKKDGLKTETTTR